MNEREISNVFEHIRHIPGPNKVDNSLLKELNFNIIDSKLDFERHYLVFFNLLTLASESSIKNGDLNNYISLIKPHGDLKKFIMLSFLKSFRVLPGSIVTKLSLMAMIEGDGNERRWITCALDLIQQGRESNDLQWPLEFYTICRGSVIIRGRTIGIPIFSYHKGLRVIRNAAQHAIDVIIKFRAKKTNSPKLPLRNKDSFFKRILSGIPFNRLNSNQAEFSKNKTIIFIGSRAFPGEANTHFNYLTNSASALKFGNENITVKLALSPEDVLISPWANFGLYDEQKMRFHRKNWKAINPKDDSIFPNSSIRPDEFNKHDYMNQMFTWIDEQEPDLIVFLSGVYESYVARAIAHLKYNTVILPTSVNHMPSSYFDYVISTSEVYSQRLIEHKVRDSSILTVPVVVNIFQDQTPFVGNFRKNENDFVLATVIGGGRLLKSFKLLSVDEIKMLEDLFSSYPSLTWILVGEPDFSGIISISEKFEGLEKEGRILGISHIKEIRSFFQNVDMVFNMPDEAGGGQGVAAAIFEGASALIPSQSDSASYVPKEGQYVELSEAVSVLKNVLEYPLAKEQFNTLCSDTLKEHFIENVSIHWQRELGLVES